ncbi:MAG: RIP metalloprotease RseP [Tissierellia bacterium]|nr:RIP metalloprotease RseP [Tissierellia bacterium]
MATLIGSIFVFLLVIMLHELGHFTVAKAVGIKVNEFSIGMGPKILQREGKETKYSIRIFPIGGYVAMEGENEDSFDPRSFNNVSVYKRMAVVVAGAVMNFLLAIVAFFFVFIGMGNGTNIIDEVIVDLPAYQGGIHTGDKIIEINGMPTKDWSEIIDLISNNENGAPLHIKYERNEKIYEQEINPVKSEDGRFIIGITSKTEKNPIHAFSLAISQTKSVVKSIFHVFHLIKTGGFESNMLSGPVGVISIIGQETSKGFINLLFILGLISANLGVINLLPIPALDGGKLLFLLIEAMIGKPIPAEWEAKLSMLGFAFLLTLMLYVTLFNDLNIFR